MELVNNNIKEILSVSHNLLTDCVNNGNVIGVHIHDENSITRNSVVVRNFSLSVDELCIEGDWFEFSINGGIKDIEFIDEENSIYILFEGKEVYLDLE